MSDAGSEDSGSPDPGDAGPERCADLACDVNATCVDSDGTPSCVCAEGFTGDGETCSDVDECAGGSDSCDESALCANREGGFVCVCEEEGPVSRETACAGIDECAGVENTCDPNATCTDLAEGFACACGAGFSGDGNGCADVAECADGALFTCDADASCRESFGGYTCECDPGFTGDGASCQGLCEVALADAGVCHANGICHVADGVAACTACGAGFQGDGVSCAAASTCAAACDGTGDLANVACMTDGSCACAPGYTGDPATGCNDADECAAAACGANSTCVELPAAGGYVCDCDDGYALDGDGNCVDVDECAKTPGPCHPDATCENSAGGFSCACPDGFSGDGSVCSDVDECALGDDNCLDDGTARCVNTRGGFQCRCRRGYTGDGVTACDNVDECSDPALNDCADDATCEDKTPEEDPVGYLCTCGEGLFGDGFSCEDVDECNNAALNDCEEHASCIDEPGGYRCECQAPFAGDDPAACYCDLSGFWAMRLDVDTCWDARGIDSVDAIAQGEMEATVWELHKYSYDGTRIVVEKKGCGNDNTPDIVSPADFFDETYSSRVLEEFEIGFPLQPGETIVEPGLVPGSSFVTPSEAAVVGIDLGDDPVNASWPTSRTQVNAIGGAPPAWDDIDEDGIPGLMLWPLTPNETTDRGGRYSYLPAATQTGSNDTLVISARAGCVSVGTRVVSHLEADVEDCTRLSGVAINESTDGRVARCWLVPMDDWDPGSPDVTCEPEDVAAMTECNGDHLTVLDDQDQSQTTTATFELVKIGELSDGVTCAEVREALPAIERSAPTITCRD